MICKYGEAYKIKIKVGSLSHNCYRIRVRKKFHIVKVLDASIMRDLELQWI